MKCVPKLILASEIKYVWWFSTVKTHACDKARLNFICQNTGMNLLQNNVIRARSMLV